MNQPVYETWISELNRLCQSRYDLDAGKCVDENLPDWYNNQVAIEEAFVRIMMRMGCVSFNGLIYGTVIQASRPEKKGE